MGAGNPKLKSFDNDRFEPTTYFLDLAADFDEVKRTLTEDNDEEPSEEQVWREVNFISEMNYEDLIKGLCSELKHGAHSRKDNHYSELSYAFRDDGVILTEGVCCYVITETGSEFGHLPIAVIPNFRFETFQSDAEFQIWDKQDWYRARGKDWDAAVEKLATKAWEKEMKLFHKEAEKILTTLHSWYGTHMRCRAGAWCSGPVESSKLAA